MSGVYEDLTVVELADRRNQWAGKLLADGGARVIQIEPLQGSPGRWCGPFVDDKGQMGLNIIFRGKTFADGHEFVKTLETSPIFSNIALAVEAKTETPATAGEVEMALSAYYVPAKGTE